MAESVIIHFADAASDDVAIALDPNVVPGNTDVSMPLGEEYLILVYDYSDFAVEYDPKEMQQIVDLLGCEPSCSLAFEFRRSQQNDACNLLKWIIEHELRSFTFVVDDSIDKVWRRSEIQDNGSAFLRSYYNGDITNG